MVIQLRLSALVAPYVDDIRKKRAAGWRWKDVRDALGVDCTDQCVGQAVRRCKWIAPQKPLPEPQKPEPQKTRTEKRNDEQQQSEPVAPRPLPTLPGKIPVGDGDAMNAALAAKGIKWR